MNCEECREGFAEYLEGLLDPSHQNRIETHLAECPACQAKLQAVQRLTVRLTRAGLDASPVSLETAVMDRIFSEQALQLRRLKMRKRLRVLGISGVMATAIAVSLISSFWFVEPAAAEKAAAEVLAQGAEAVSNPTTIHIVAKMRTIGRDNFSMIGADYDFVPVQIWKQFGDKPKWSVEKPGRVAVMDGDSTAMLIRPDYVVQFPHASQAAFDTGWLLALTNVQDLITHELRAAQAREWEMKLTHETTGAGDKAIVTVEAKSGLPADDYLKNKLFENSDMRRVYRFDAKTKRLEGFDAYLHQTDGDVLILAVERIEYDKPIDSAVFKLKLPEKVSLYKEPERLEDNEKYEKMTPEQTARAFFEACGKKDWDEAKKFLIRCDDRTKSYLGGLELISLGTPFQSKGYGGWFIPYEIKLHLEKKVVVRNDNPAKRCILFFDPDQSPTKEMLAEVKELPDNAKYEKMTPEEALRAFFDACKAENWDEARKYLYLSPSISDEQSKAIQTEMAALTKNNAQIGKAVAIDGVSEWEIPYEVIVLKKHNLAVRNDNPAKRFIVDGGF